MELNNISLNYRELAFVSDEYNSRETKEIFCDILEKDKVKIKEEISLFTIINKAGHKFKSVRSLDKRYDGKKDIEVKLMLMSSGYRKYLQTPNIIKQKKFTGGKAVFYKLLTQEQIDHAHKALEASHNFYYNENKTPEN